MLNAMRSYAVSTAMCRRKMLLENPAGVLRAAGMDPGTENVQIHEEIPGSRHFVLPAKPGDVSVEEAHQSLLSDANPGF